ncbi:MAG: glycosyltransferase [Pirellulales bacterium]
MAVNTTRFEVVLVSPQNHSTSRLAMPAPAPVPILFCITSLEPGGAEHALVDLATRLPSDRFSPRVVSLAPRPDRRRAHLVQTLEQHRIETRFLEARHLVQTRQVVRRLRCVMEGFRPSIVQTFLFHANVLGAVAARMAGVPHVVAGIRVAERRQNLHRWIMRRMANSVERYVCVSQAVADFADRQIGLPRERLNVIPTGVDAQRFPAEPAAGLDAFGVPAGDLAVLYVGRLDRQKRAAWLLQSAADFLRRLPRCHLLLLGRGDEERKLRRRVRQMEARDRVHFLGWRDDVPEIVAAADLLVLPSAWEGMPRVVLEAMASAKPVVATDVEGVGELLGEVGGGQIVGVQRPGEFADAVVRLISNPRQSRALGERNRKRVVEQFSIERSVAAYQKLYESLLARSRNSPRR